MKTHSSRRKVPIHSALIEHGFLDHVRSMRKRGLTDVFPELRPSKPGDRFGEKLDYNFRKALETVLDGNPRRLCFHAFRHYVKQQLDGHPSVSPKARRDILGHEATDVHDGVYGTEATLRELQRAIELLPFPLATEHGD
ncbi:hypothetical protein [Pseudoroseicyclus tamaricis]|uniref:hypothetical protein n=1 Tax=Pseudoroseicyclus tamaricis TaxID=2705421 RepID=UPI001432F920|nr:hypothetical protein [Pseudoroseicyclus tamaricis]